MSGYAAGAPRRSGLLDAFAVQARVIGALMMRELHTRFGRHNLGYLWLFVEPAMLGGGVSGAHLLTGHGMPGGISVVEFWVLGYVPYYVLRAIFTRAAGTVESNRTLLVHRQVTAFDMLVARSLLELGSAILVGAVFTLACSLLGEPWPADPLKMLASIILMVLLFHGFAMIVCAGSEVSELVERFAHPLTYLMIPIVGAFTMCDWFSPAVRAWFLTVPMVNIFELLRDGQFGDRVTTYYSIPYVFAWIAGAWLLGLTSLQAVRSKMLGA